MRTTLLLLAAGTLVVCAAACSKKNSSTAGGDVLTSGNYTASNAAVAPDGCQVSAIEVANGDTVTVAASTTVSNGQPTTYTIDDLPFTTGNGGLTTPVLTQVNNWTNTTAQIASGLSPLSQGYDCVETQTFADSATITGFNAFSYQEVVNFVVTSGQAPQCVVAENSEFNAGLTSYPCTSTAVYDASL